jgi:hypothetical protein
MLNLMNIFRPVKLASDNLFSSPGKLKDHAGRFKCFVPLLTFPIFKKLKCGRKRIPLPQIPFFRKWGRKRIPSPKFRFFGKWGRKRIPFPKIPFFGKWGRKRIPFPKIPFFGKWGGNEFLSPKFRFLENGEEANSPPPNSVFWKMGRKRIPLPQIPFFGIWGRLGGGLFRPLRKI